MRQPRYVLPSLLYVACIGCGTGFLGDGTESANTSSDADSSDTAVDEATSNIPIETDDTDSTDGGLTDLPVEDCEPIEFLPFRPIDVEYDELHDLLVVVTDSPHELHLYNPATSDDVVYDLPLSPTSVSVGPDNLAVAIGHDAQFSYLDIDAGVVETLAIATDVFDIVLAGNGWVYGFPGSGQWTEIFAVEVESGMQVTSGASIRENTRAKLHPDGLAIYGADNGLSPSDIERYGIELGPPTVLYDSPYHGDYAMCGDLWISDDGGRIFTRCGNTFRASNNQVDDMTYAGSLGMLDRVRHLDHSRVVGRVVAIPDSTDNWGDDPVVEDTQLQFYGDQFLDFQDSIDLPLVATPTGCFELHGRFAFFDSSGEVVHVLAQIDAASGALLDHVLLTITAPPS